MSLLKFDSAQILIMNDWYEDTFDVKIFYYLKIQLSIRHRTNNVDTIDCYLIIQMNDYLCFRSIRGVGVINKQFGLTSAVAAVE